MRPYDLLGAIESFKCGALSLEEERQLERHLRANRRSQTRTKPRAYWPDRYKNL